MTMLMSHYYDHCMQLWRQHLLSFHQRIYTYTTITRDVVHAPREKQNNRLRHVRMTKIATSDCLTESHGARVCSNGVYV